jgi:aminodeoxyfutalosine deaminase
LKRQGIAPVLHRAPLVVPVAGPPIEDGGVLCRDGVILDLGRFAGLRASTDVVVDHEGCVITPALINGHTHLELSHLAGLGQTTAAAPGGGFTAWIAALLHERERSAACTTDIEAAARTAVADLRKTGTILAADIGNQPETLVSENDCGVEVCFHRELLGLSRAAVREARKLLAIAEPAAVCTAHAPHSTAAELIITLKRRGAVRGQLFSLHVAESAEEIEFLRAGSGPFRTFLEGRGSWDGSFTPPASGAVEYLDKLGVLDSRTLCVHCVHLSKPEIAILAARQANICLCPGSNRTLGVGKAPVAGMLAAGLLPALGTDSLASNPCLDLWREMRLLREDHPAIHPEKIFAMATSGGAVALAAGHRLGSLGPGKSARMLAVRAEVFTPVEIFDYLTTRGRQAETFWIY